MNMSEANPSDLALRNIESLLPDLAEFYKDVHSHPSYRCKRRGRPNSLRTVFEGPAMK